MQEPRGQDFRFIDRELTPLSSAAAGKRRWLAVGTYRRVSLDALLVNVHDLTPIVAEIKVGGDENAELALVQALAAAAQLSTSSQLKRLHREYRDHLGPAVPSRLDVYVITARAPTRGTRPQLARRARQRAHYLETGGQLAEWIRRVAFLEMTLADGALAFSTPDDGAD